MQLLRNYHLITQKIKFFIYDKNNIIVLVIVCSVCLLVYIHRSKKVKKEKINVSTVKEKEWNILKNNNTLNNPDSVYHIINDTIITNINKEIICLEQYLMSLFNTKMSLLKDIISLNHIAILDTGYMVTGCLFLGLHVMNNIVTSLLGRNPLTGRKTHIKGNNRRLH